MGVKHFSHCLAWMRKSNPITETLLAEHCDEVDKKTVRPKLLFDFRRHTLDTKLRTLGRCGITDVVCSPPLEPVSGANWKPEGRHIHMWITLLEQVLGETIGYNAELLEVLLSEDMESEELRKKLEAEV